jgi:hypothetical protein
MLHLLQEPSPTEQWIRSSLAEHPLVRHKREQPFFCKDVDRYPTIRKWYTETGGMDGAGKMTGRSYRTGSVAYPRFRNSSGTDYPIIAESGEPENDPVRPLPTRIRASLPAS